MRTQPDALLSVRRWVRSVLPGPPWRILLAGDEGRVERPYAVVNTADGASVSTDAPEVARHVLPIAVHCFPLAGSRASASKLIAERVAAGLELGIRAGVPDWAVPEVRGAHRRIPLWDYGGVNPEDYMSEEALDKASSADRLPPDYLLVSDGWKAATQPQTDSADLFVATLEMRVQWFSPTGLRSGGELLQSARVRIE